jgi:hypothetical protein
MTCDENCHIIRCIESDNFCGYVGIHEARKDNISEEEHWTKINVEKNILSYIEKDFSEKSQNCCRT